MSDDVFTYIVGEEGTSYVKIGRTSDIERRLAALQTGNPRRLILHALIPGDSESEFHERYGLHHERGEWFDPSWDMMAEIQYLTSRHPPPDHKRRRCLSIRPAGGRVIEWAERHGEPFFMGDLQAANRYLEGPEAALAVVNDLLESGSLRIFSGDGGRGTRYVAASLGIHPQPEETLFPLAEPES